ncbi:MAG: hypothetical protein R3E52_07080 [Burkholderiaceae bacterium]
MKRLMIAALCAVGGLSHRGGGGYLLTMLLSSNMHDRAVEAAMAGAFVGPLGAVAAFMAGWWMA